MNIYWRYKGKIPGIGRSRNEWIERDMEAWGDETRQVSPRSEPREAQPGKLVTVRVDAMLLSPMDDWLLGQ